MKTYTVTWIIKNNRQGIPYEKTFEAENAKEARKAFDRYYDSLIGRSVLSHYPHPFHIKVTLNCETKRSIHSKNNDAR